MTLSEKRTTKFQRNQLLEQLLGELGSDLTPSENLLLNRYSDTGSLPFPLILIMGPLRSGTTLFTQWLASLGLVSYPTNLLSRFYKAPIIGAKIQLLLTDPRFNFRDELGDFARDFDFFSENGKTQGVLAPNEFWYFWRRFLADPSRDVWSDAELRCSMDTRTMLAELAGVMDVFQKPFAAKGMLFNYNIPFLNESIDNVIFIQLQRDLPANVASVLDARRRQLGSAEAWYSFRIPEYEQLIGLPPAEQVTGQIRHINLAIENGLAQVDPRRKLTVQYEDFCHSPTVIYQKLVSLLGIEAPEYSGPTSFQISRP